MSESQPQPSTSQTLDSYITPSKPAPKVLATSAEIRDRGSTFVANILSATSPEEAKTHVKYVKYVLHGNKPASHEVAAWRCMVIKHGHTGLGGPEDFELATGSLDDGEKWAGNRVLKIMESLGIIDAVVIVSRWYGGILLGPLRFNHIETCTAEVCGVFKRTEELRESIATLETLDALLTGLRQELKALQASSRAQDPQPSTLKAAGVTREQVEKKADYSSVDLVKARRLIKARENAIQWTKDALAESRSKGTKE